MKEEDGQSTYTVDIVVRLGCPRGLRLSYELHQAMGENNFKIRG